MKPKYEENKINLYVEYIHKHRDVLYIAVYNPPVLQ